MATDTLRTTAETVRNQLTDFAGNAAELGSNAASTVASVATDAATSAVETARERVLEANRLAAQNVDRLGEWLPNVDVNLPDVSKLVNTVFDAQRKVIDANQKFAQDVLKIWQAPAAPAKPAATTARKAPSARKTTAKRSK